MTESVYELAKENQSSKSLHSNKGSVVSKNSSTLTCSICLSKILDPAHLTCGHKFCEACLQKYWDSSDRPTFIICPLCRANVFDVNFTKKSTTSMGDFRKSFRNCLDSISEGDDVPTASMTCLKISILLPAAYYLVKWVVLPLTDLLLTKYRIKIQDLLQYMSTQEERPLLSSMQLKADDDDIATRIYRTQNRTKIQTY